MNSILLRRIALAICSLSSLAMAGNYDGQVIGSPFASIGKFGTSLRGSGSSYITTPAGLYNNPANGNWTIEGWHQLSAPTGGIAVSIGSYGSATWMGVGPSGNALCSVTGLSPWIIDSGVSIADGNWHHLACTMANGNTAKLYVDGVLRATATGSYNGPGNAQGALGTFIWAPTVYPFTNGYVDEVAFWTVTRYTSNFTPNSAPYVGNETNLRALYHLNSNAVDSAGSSNQVITQPLFTSYDLTGTQRSQGIRIWVPSTGSATPWNGTFGSPTSGSPRRLVIYAHGAGENKTAPETNPDKAAIFTALLHAGYFIAATDACFDSWGSQCGVDSYADLYRSSADNLNIKDVVILSQSMGGLTGLSTISQGKVPNIKGWAGIYPVANLRNLYDHPSYQQTIANVYSIPVGASVTEYNKRTWGLDPLVIAQQNPKAFQGVRMRSYASPDDTIVTMGLNTTALRNALIAYNPDWVIIPCIGEHGHPSHFQPTDLLSFFQSIP